MDIDAELRLEIAIRRRIAETVESRIAWAEALALSLASGRASADTLRSLALHTLAQGEAPSALILAPEPRPPSPPHPPSVPKNPFLYLSSPTLHLLRCPVCLRTSFTSLQGLLNHARLAHRLDWGTHDDCIRACAVPDNDLDLNNGIHVRAGIPALRSLFQSAVAQPTTRSLGIHQDTPALAPYLGKHPVKRRITVYDDNCPVDITSLPLPSPKPWSMPFSPRNGLDIHPHHHTPPLRLPTEPPLSAQSRFHFVARIVVVDRSVHATNTHQWMISVDAPAYSQHITTLLHSISLLDPPPGIVIHPSPQPPFVIIGTASSSFLASLRLSFVGTTDGIDRQEISVDHWVELTTSKYLSIGDSQVLDIELSRHTALKPLVEGYTPITSKSFWPPASVSDPTPTPPDYESILSRLAAQFPMTEKDLGPRGNRRPPSMWFYLPPSAVLGRRKAIEWRRARAIRDAYNALNSSDLPELTVGDVFSWLQSKQDAVPAHQLDVIEPTCRICGLPAQVFERRRPVSLCDGQPCTVAPLAPASTRLPSLGIGAFSLARNPISLLDPIHLGLDPVAQADPGWILWVREAMGHQDQKRLTLMDKKQLATPAILALATQRLASILIQGGLAVAAADKARVLHNKTLRPSVTQSLTPSHVLRSLLGPSVADLPSQPNVILSALSTPALPVAGQPRSWSTPTRVV